MTLPNFIVIGAAKAGTTALYHYLDEHPQVFMSQVKETNFFAYGLDAGGKPICGGPDVRRFGVRTLPEYERLFAGAGDALAIGEASPLYLECPPAAARIKELLPAARIICSIRHPVDRAYSDYQMHLRHEGRRLDPDRDLDPAADWARPGSHWMQIGRYYGQLARYFELFPRERILVCLFDDLKRSPRGVMEAVYRFLGVDPAFQPDFDTPHAPGGLPMSRILESLFTSKAIQAAVKPLIPAGAANWFKRVRRRNLQPAPRLPAKLKAELTRHFRDDITQTSALIGRNLDHWLQPGS
jgi:Sulfotransferase family